MQPTIVLFDVDGTLISSGGAGRRALEQAFVDLFETAGWLKFSFAGMTDLAIIDLALKQGQQTRPHDSRDHVLNRYLFHLPATIEEAEDYRIFPGIVDVLRFLEAHDHVAVGLGTGNVARGAYIKLARGELDTVFSFGGFGCDHVKRDLLLQVGAERGATRLGAPLSTCRVIVVGDTPKDIDAATAIGAESVAVATGPFAPSELTAAGATVAFETLAERAAQTWFEERFHGRMPRQ